MKNVCIRLILYKVSKIVNGKQQTVCFFLGIVSIIVVIDVLTM
jgi:hypothetical protein